MSETKTKRVQVSTRDFVVKYLPLQGAGKNRAECAKAFAMDEASFNTKLSNATLELFITSGKFNVNGKVVSGPEFAEAYREHLRKSRLAEAEAATYQDEVVDGVVKMTAAALKEKAITAASRTTTLDAMREIRKGIREKDENITKMLKNPGELYELPTPVGGRKNRDLSAILDIARAFSGNTDADDADDTEFGEEE